MVPGREFRRSAARGRVPRLRHDAAMELLGRARYPHTVRLDRCQGRPRAERTTTHSTMRAPRPRPPWSHCSACGTRDRSSPKLANGILRHARVQAATVACAGPALRIRRNEPAGAMDQPPLMRKGIRSNIANLLARFFRSRASAAGVRWSQGRTRWPTAWLKSWRAGPLRSRGTG